MRKVTLFVILLAFAVSSAFAIDFVATPMTLSAPAQVQYDFDGSTFNLPLTVTTGPGGGVYFLVFTNGKASTISAVQNGYLGWHYVNKIDTCLYISPITAVTSGSNTITWDGKGEGGALVPADTYTYYVFGFDNITSRSQVTKQASVGPWQFRAWITHDTAGVPVSNPSFSYATGAGTNDALGASTLRRWTVGDDPENAALLETTANMTYANAGGGSKPGYDPADHGFYYRWSQKGTDTRYVQRWEWVPQGESIQDMEWADGGDCITNGTWATWSCFGAGVESDNMNTLYIVSSDIGGDSDVSSVIYIDNADGSVANVFDISNWWVDPQDKDAGGQMNGGPLNFEFNRYTNQAILGAHSSCIFQMFDPYYEDEGQATLWVNQNGDYTGDHNFQPDLTDTKWVCNDYNVQPYSYTCYPDANMFVLFTCFDMGAVSFGLMAPDGSGMGYQALAGETAAQKYGLDIVDYGGAFDGLYTTNNSNKVNPDTGDPVIDATWWYVGHDSIKGVIAQDIVGVADAPAAFAVAQNVPNPFNPTTTINFTLAKAGKVTVDVYNVAGQKVDTIVNAPMNAGSHSVTWNASKFSAGVYFYTVKSGGFSETMKMTLLK